MFIEAIRTIQPGEELYYDYEIKREKGDPENVDEIFACRCGAATCRGTMLEERKPPRKRKAAKKKAKAGKRARAEHHAHGRTASRH